MLEAGDRPSGRILSSGGFDMGPAWVWPGQPRIAALLPELALGVFEQHWTGEQVFEDAQGPVHRGPGRVSLRVSLRVAGGLGALTNALATRLPLGVLRLGEAATGLERADGGVVVRTPQDAHVGAHAVLALPPRLAAMFGYAPALPTAALEAMRAVPTWMAGHAKAVAVYPLPFWREAGLSGDAGSRRGPMVEVHDASPVNAGKGALFGFMGVPPEARGDGPALRAATLAQFVRLFGAEADAPERLTITDWARDPFTATPPDAEPPTHHPRYGLPPELTGLWDGRLMLGSTEVAAEFGGFVEGALEAAEAVLARL